MKSILKHRSLLFQLKNKNIEKKLQLEFKLINLFAIVFRSCPRKSATQTLWFCGKSKNWAAVARYLRSFVDRNTFLSCSLNSSATLLFLLRWNQNVNKFSTFPRQSQQRVVLCEHHFNFCEPKKFVLRCVTPETWQSRFLLKLTRSAITICFISA